MPILLPSAVPNTSAPLVSVTGLYHTACTPPVYASQAGSLPHRATLGSGGWPVLSGSGLSPAGSQQEVSACLLHVNMLPPLPGFAWRNGTMIKAGGSGKHGSWSAKKPVPLASIPSLRSYPLPPHRSDCLCKTLRRPDRQRLHTPLPLSSSIQIPIASCQRQPGAKLPAVSSLEAYQTPTADRCNRQAQLQSSSAASSSLSSIRRQASDNP